MQRDMDLVRAILLEVEQHQEPQAPFEVQAHGYSPEQIAYHVRLLAEAGYIDAIDFGDDWQPKSLNWSGHEFLDATRNAGIWQKVKAELKDRGGSLLFSLIQQLALKLAAAQFGLSSGK